MSPKNWTLNAYTPNEWTDLARADARIAAIIISNPTGAAINASLRLTDGPTRETAIIVPPIAIAAGDSQQLAISRLNLGSNDRLQFKGSVVGLNIVASGEQP